MEAQRLTPKSAYELASHYILLRETLQYVGKSFGYLEDAMHLEG
jgi:hypothetical protein